LVARLLIRWACIIALLLTMAVGVIRAQPYHDNGLSELLNSPCDSPCWQQIYPGVTSGEDALAIMQQFDLAQDVGSRFETRTGQIFWHWSEEAASYLDLQSPHVPYIWLRNNVVSHIFLPDFYSYIDTFLVLGRPEKVYIFTDPAFRSGYAIYVAGYPGNFYVTSLLLCEARPSDLWHSTANIYIGGEPDYSGAQSREYKLSELEGWLPETLCTYRR
jgi:hypothetical protein